MEKEEVIIIGLLALGSILFALFVQTYAVYGLLAFFLILFFLGYLIIKDQRVGFDTLEYASLFESDLIDISIKRFNNEVKEIYLTGEDVFRYKLIGKCCGYATFGVDKYPEDFDIVQEKGQSVKVPKEDPTKKETKEFVTLQYLQYSSNIIRYFFQITIGQIPLLSNVLCSLPVIGWFISPDIKSIITPLERCLFKNNIVELKGKSLIPLKTEKIKTNWAVLEYGIKSQETREAEQYIFSRAIASDYGTKLVNWALNMASIGAKLNPAVKVKQEESLTKTK